MGAAAEGNIVCTDPCNGLMQDLKRSPSPLRGNPKVLVGLMKRLKATEVSYHRDLLLAIVSGSPILGSAYMEEFPYNLEDFSSSTWSVYFKPLHVQYVLCLLVPLYLYICMVTEAFAGLLQFLLQQTWFPQWALVVPLVSSILCLMIPLCLIARMCRVS